MSDSKIQIKIGIVEFSGEGNQDWLASQLDKILVKIPELLKIELSSNSEEGRQNHSIHPKKKLNAGTLASWLKDKNATSNQIRKFLATATFLQMSGKERISTSDVTEALRNSNQGRLTNASDSLNQNVGKGHCEKDGKQFFVTPEGLKELGLAEE